MEFVAAEITHPLKFEETRKRALAELRNANAHRRQPHMACHRNIVETRQRRHPRELEPGIAECLQRSDRHIVVGRKYRVEAMSAAQQCAIAAAPNSSSKSPCMISNSRPL